MFRFGRANHDEMTILAPLHQCCSVRLSTVRTLLDLQTSSSSSSGSGRLSDRMRQSLSKDPLSPVVSDAHLEALDRRVGIVLDQIHQCLQRSDGSRQVILNYWMNGSFRESTPGCIGPAKIWRCSGCWYRQSLSESREAGSRAEIGGQWTLFVRRWLVRHSEGCIPYF